MCAQMLHQMPTELLWRELGWAHSSLVLTDWGPLQYVGFELKDVREEGWGCLNHLTPSILSYLKPKCRACSWTLIRLTRRWGYRF